MTLQTFDELMLDLNEQIPDNLGTEATFTPLSGSPVTLNVVFDREVEYMPNDFSGQVAAYAYFISVSLTALGQVPVRGDAFTVYGTNYTVMELDRDQTDQDWFKMKVKE